MINVPKVAPSGAFIAGFIVENAKGESHRFNLYIAILVGGTINNVKKELTQLLIQ